VILGKENDMLDLLLDFLLVFAGGVIGFLISKKIVIHQCEKEVLHAYTSYVNLLKKTGDNCTTLKSVYTKRVKGMTNEKDILR